MTPLASIAIAGCLAVSAGADHITVRDLAPAVPGFVTLEDRPVALAPAPGVQRIFRIPELRRLALGAGIPDEPRSEICFERKVAPLDRDRVLDALRKQLPGSAIQIVDFSKQPVPDGDLEFPLSGLRQTSSGGFWNGAVRYGGHRFLVWAKVEVQAEVARVFATEDLSAGRPIMNSQLRLETRKAFPEPGTYLETVEDAVGRIPGRSIAKGAALKSQWLTAMRDVARGDTVEVDVWNGSAHLRLSAVAEGAGSKGQVIPLRNPESKKRFWGEISGKGRVAIGKEGL